MLSPVLIPTGKFNKLQWLVPNSWSHRWPWVHSRSQNKIEKDINVGKVFVRMGVGVNKGGREIREDRQEESY